MTQDTNDTTPNERPRRLLVYVGKRENMKGAASDAYMPMPVDWDPDNPPDLDLDAFCSWRKIGGYMRPGAVFSIEHEPGEPARVFTDSAQVVGHLNDQTCAEWAAESRAIENSINVRREAKKDAQRDLDLEQLEPLRRAYRHLRTKQERAILLGRVIDYMTRSVGI